MMSKDQRQPRRADHFCYRSGPVPVHRAENDDLVAVFTGCQREIESVELRASQFKVVQYDKQPHDTFPRRCIGR